MVEPERNGGERKTADEADPFVEELRRNARALLDELGLLAQLRWQRVRLATREFGFRLVLGAWVAVFGFVATVVAAWLFVVGLSAALADLFDGAPWLGPLLTGFLILSITPLVLLGLRRRHRQRFARELVDRYEPKVAPRPRTPPQSPPAPRPKQARHAP